MSCGEPSNFVQGPSALAAYIKGVFMTLVASIAALPSSGMAATAKRTRPSFTALKAPASPPVCTDKRTAGYFLESAFIKGGKIV